MSQSLAERLAIRVDARARCLASNDLAKMNWAESHTERIESLVREHMPSGSGFDNGTQLDLEKSQGERLVFNTAFHHMDESGGYCGWTQHKVTVKPSLLFGFTLQISGRDFNGIKDYIAQTFQHALSQEGDS